MPAMSKKLRLVFGALGLAGIFTCALIEPALAEQDEASHSESSEESECCMIQCGACQPWVTPFFQVLTFNSKYLRGRTTEVPSCLPDPPVGSIFHPPLTV
jgi:hypothetical protein